MSKRIPTPIIAITGGTGSGKSTVASVFKRMGARVIDVDRLARRVSKPGSPSWYEIIETFCGATYHGPVPLEKQLKPEDFQDAQGTPLPELPWVINAAGAIRRDRLGATVFSDANALKNLNRIMHPALRKLLVAKIDLHRKLTRRPLVLDMAVYPERLFRNLADIVVWVRAPGGMRVQRLVTSKRLSQDEATARIQIQWKDQEYEKCADFILPNLGSDEDVVKGAEELWPRILRRAAGE